jgi:hypothetical protein
VALALAAATQLTTGGLARRPATARPRSSPRTPRWTPPTSTCSRATSRARGLRHLIANYLPLQDAYGGPNYFTLDPEALYEIHVDNNGDAKEDLTFQFRFKNRAGRRRGLQLDVGGKMVAVPLAQHRPITAADTSKLNVLETYGVRWCARSRRNASGDVTNAADGRPSSRSRPTTSAPRPSPGARLRQLRRAHSTTSSPRLRHRRAHVRGPARESFAVNLGTIFDLVNAPPEVVVRRQHARRPRLVPAPSPTRTSPAWRWSCPSAA